QRAAENRPGAEARLVAVGDPVNDQGGKPVHLGGVQIIAAHEDFDAAQRALAFEAERRADFFLVLEGELVLVFAGGEVKLVAHPEEKILGLLQLRDIGGADDAVQRQGFDVLNLETGARDPARGLQIAQPALAFLYVGLDQIDRAAKLLVAQARFFELLADKALDAVFHQARLDLFLEVFVQRKIAAEKARVEQRGAHFHVALGQAHAVGDAPGGVADLKAGVPQGVEQLLGDRFDKRRNLPDVEKQQIDVRLRIELAAAVAALGDQRDPAVGGRELLAVVGADRSEQVADQMIHHRGPRRSDFQAAGAAAVALEQRAPAVVDVTARLALEIGLGLRAFEQGEGNGDGVHGLGLKRFDHLIGLAVFLNAFEERFDHGVLVARQSERAAFDPVGDEKHFHQHARHARADENVEQRLLDAEVFHVVHHFAHAAHQRALNPVGQGDRVLELHALGHIAQYKL